LGSGVSTALPNMRHVLDFATSSYPCSVCKDGIIAGSKNKRNNVSIAITFDDVLTKEKRCIMIDAGKTMRQVSSKFYFIFTSY
jgi:hypothetical protein